MQMTLINNEKNKISLAAYRVLLILKLLNEDKRSIDEINEIFLKDPLIKNKNSKEVIIKYITTLRFAGFNITKPDFSNDYCYSMPKPINLLEFDLNCIKSLPQILKCMSYIHQPNLYKNLETLIVRLKRFLTDENLCLLKLNFIS